MRIEEKAARYDAIASIERAVSEELATQFANEPAELSSLAAIEARQQLAKQRRANTRAALRALRSELMRARILEERTRIDGRKPADVRNIACEIRPLPRAHGVALFTRGETQALVYTTLGSTSDAQTIDALHERSSKTFLLHYNFPPFSVGEVRPLRGPSRRDIGHGNLAERALMRMLPGVDDFPYTVRVVSEVLESNGSSSMATVCGGTLAMMDAGVPLQARRWPASPWAWSKTASGTWCSRTSSATKTTWATWTSRWPARAKASPRCRWTSRLQPSTGR